MEGIEESDAEIAVEPLPAVMGDEDHTWEKLEFTKVCIECGKEMKPWDE